MSEYARLVVAVDSTQVKTAERDLQSLGVQSRQIESAVTSLATKAAAAFGGIKLGGLIKDVTMANSRFEQLGLVMGVVGRNAGLSSEQVTKYAKDVQAMGISMTESRQTVIRMTQAQMDLSKASDLARLAQDAAVIANTNSSEALGRLIYGLQSGQVEILRNMGLNVNFAGSYSKLAAEMGVTADQLSEVDKVQARTNAVMEAGAQIAGAYEASMENAAKQVGSTTRYLQDMGVMWGGVFSKAGHDAVFSYAEALKSLHKRTEELRDSGTLDRLADAIATISRGVVTGAKVLGAYAVAVYAIPAAKAAATVATTAYQAVLATFSAQVAVTTAQLLTMRTALNTLAAGFAGWQIGTYLRNEFEIVEKAGIALMGGLHTMAIQVGGYFERLGASISFALTNPLDAFRNKLADLLQSLSGLGQRGLRMLGLDDFADAIGNGIEKIRSQTGEEHRAMLEQMRKDTQREADAVSEIYAQMFADVGKSAGANLNVVSKGLDDVLDRLGGFNDELEETGGNTGGITKVDTAFQSLYDSLFPAEAAQRKYNEQVALLSKHLSGDRLARAIDRLNESMADGDHTGPADAIAEYRKELERLEDKINPAGRAAREFREEQALLRAEIERSGDPTGKYTALLADLERQYEENSRVTTQWAQWTESALERVDSAFADAWRNIGDGFGSFRDNLVNAFKQMLAELAHLAITRPIVLQIGAAMGIGGVAGMAGIGGGSGGGMDIVSLARMGYQAYQGVTGTGLIGSIATGFKTGGLAGAWTGATGWAGGAASGLNAAAGQIYGVATQGGAGLTTYAPLTYQMGGLSNTVAGIAPWASGLGGAYMGWQQAGAKGAIAGGLGGWGGAKASAALGSLAGPIGTAVGAVVGGILGSIGGARLFGSGEQYKRTVGSATGSYIDGQYVSGGQSQTWFAGYHRTFGDEFNQTLDDLNRQFSSVLGGLFDAFDIDSTIETETRARQRRTSGRLAADFLVTIDGEMAEHLRQYGGKGDVAKAMEEFADDIMGEYLAKTIVNSALPEYLRDQFRGLTEADQVAETLAGVIARFDGVNSALDLVGITLLETTDAGLRAADAIAAMGGGIEAFNASVGVYYDQFFTVAEKQADTISAVEKAFEAANITLAESREGYRAMVEDIDVTTEAGQQMFATMMSLSGMAAEYYSILEQRAAQSLAAAQEAAAMQAAMQAAQAAQIAAATQSAAQSAISAARGALSGLSAAIQAEQGRIAASYQAQSSSLQQSLMAANSSLSEMRLVASKLRSTVNSLRLESEQYAELTRRGAQQTISNALSSGGRVLMTPELERALDTVTRSSENLFGSFEDYARDYWQTYFAIEALAERAEDQVSIEEQAVKALEARVSQAQAFHNAEMARLDEMYESAVQQLNALLGIDDSVQDVGTAMERFAATISALQKLQDANASITSVVGLNGVRRQVASDGTVLGDTGESMGLRVDGRQVVGIADHTAGWRFDLGADGQMSWAAGQDESMMEWARRQGIPGFASGGLFGGGMRLVGENGPELEVTGPSRIYTADQTARMLGGGAETAAAISRLEQTVARQGDALRAIAKHTMKSARNTEVLERWDYDGLPEERALA